MGNESSIPEPVQSTTSSNPLENQAILKSIEQSGESQYSAKIKCVLLGAMGVGKTSFKSRFLWDEFRDAQDPTMGASRHITTRENITDQETFYRATTILKTVKKTVPPDTIILIVGNKTDLENKREQSGEDAAEQYKGECFFFEMSCRENRNVQHPLYLLAGMIDRMVESLVQKKVPIPRAKPRLADATPSSVLSRSNEFRIDKSRAKFSSPSATSSGSSSYASEGEDNGEVKTIESKGEIKIEKKVEVEIKSVVNNPISPPKPRIPVNNNWWENSPYVKRINDDFIFSCAERVGKTSECVSVELTITKTSLILENTPASSSFTIAPVEGLFRFLSRRDLTFLRINYLAKGCSMKVSEDTHHPQRLEIFIKRKPFGGILEGSEIYEEDICILACPLRSHLIKILKAQLPLSTTFGTNSHSLTRADFLQVYREHSRFTKGMPYRPIEDQIKLDSGRSDLAFDRLDVSRVLRDSRQLAPVLEGLRWNASIQHLDLSYNNLGLPGLTSCKICRISHTLYTITSLDLSYNKLGKESVPFLIGLLGSIPTLKVLLVDGNGLSDVAPIGVNLYTNTTLTTLGLSRNNITSDSILTFARALVINTTLVSLDLSSNLLTEEVSMPLLNALSCNSNLTRLCVLGNPDLHKETIIHLTLPKLSQPIATATLREEETDNGTVGNAGTPLLATPGTTPDFFVDDICEKCKLEKKLASRYFIAADSPKTCTHMTNR